MIKDLTFQQFCALDYHRNMVVTSGPGAGKTKILSHRFCFILLTDDAVSLPQILTLTFTEKAAEEMKRRIYEMLGQLESDLTMRRRRDNALDRQVRQAREQFHRNRISTIHSFCANLLREHPVESGIDPSFVIIQGARKRKLMARSIEAGVSSMLRHNKDDLSQLLHIVGGRRRLLLSISKAVEHPLVFKRVVKTAQRLFHTAGWQEQVFRDYCQVIKDKHLIPYLEGLRAMKEGGRGQFKEILALFENWYSKLEHCPNDYNLPNLFRSLRQIAKDRKPSSSRLSIREGLRGVDYLDLVDGFYPDLFYLGHPDEQFERELGLFLNAARFCLEHYQAEKRKINALDFSDLEAFCHSFLERLFESEDQQGLKRVQNRFKYIMVDEFQDTNRVQWEIISLLCSRKDQKGKAVLHPRKLFVVGDKRQAIYRFRGGDVTVFEDVTERIRQSNRGQTAPMFWKNREVIERIGDIEDGCLALIKRHTEAFESLPHSEIEKIRNGDIYLPHNFRTASQPIQFLNTTFEQIFSNKGARRRRAYETAPMPIVMPDANHCFPGHPGSTTLYLTCGQHSRKDQLEREASLVADIIEGLLGRHGEDRYEYKQYADIREKIEKDQSAIGILFFSFTHLGIFETILREAGLPFRVHRGKGFYRCQEVLDMVQLLNYLIDERQHISLLAVLRSPMFALTDAEIFDLFCGNRPTLSQMLSSQNPRVRSVGRQIQSWRHSSCRLTLAELIRTIIIDRNLTAIHSFPSNGVQRLANMEKLIDVGRRFEAEGNGALPEFVQYCLEMVEEEEEEGEALLAGEGESPICLMTIHAAKGLEFPMVIIPDLARRPPTRIGAGQPIRLYSSQRPKAGAWNSEEGEIPVWTMEIPELDFRKAHGPLGYLLTRRNKLEDMAENRRVFYVGCTRAMSHLLLIGHMQERLMEKKKAALSSEDYRERATIMELLDDIYGFPRNYPPEKSEFFEGGEGLPAVIWKDPKPRPYKGTLFGGEKITRKHFGIYDETVKKLDLTEPLRAHPFYQFSFSSIQIFRRCPIMFYYGVILGLKRDGLAGLLVGGSDTPESHEEDNAWEYGSKEGLFIGNVIHGYLEKHRFGMPFDESLFGRAFGRFSQPDGYQARPDTRNLNLLRERALKDLKTAIYDERLAAILKGEARYAEVPFLFTVSQGCEFRGTIDLLLSNKKGHWGIIDWKSHELEDRDPRLVAEENGYDLQLACYKWAVEHILNEKVVDLYLYFTDGGHLLKSHWEGEQPRAIVEEMLQEVRDYEINRERWVQDFTEVKREIRDCRFCEYRAILCKEAGRS